MTRPSRGRATPSHLQRSTGRQANRRGPGPMATSTIPGTMAWKSRAPSSSPGAISRGPGRVGGPSRSASSASGPASTSSPCSTSGAASARRAVDSMSSASRLILSPRRRRGARSPAGRRLPTRPGCCSTSGPAPSPASTASASSPWASPSTSRSWRLAKLSESWTGAADAWFLDGFSPALNPQMWRPEVIDLIAARSAPGARIGTYTVASAVRRDLAARRFRGGAETRLRQEAGAAGGATRVRGSPRSAPSPGWPSSAGALPPPRCIGLSMRLASRRPSSPARPARHPRRRVPPPWSPRAWMRGWVLTPPCSPRPSTVPSIFTARFQGR